MDESIVHHYRAIASEMDIVVLPQLIELGLTMPQLKALVAVVSAPPEGISVTELGTALGIGQPSASLILNQVERLGFVERKHDETDRRRVLITPTKAGLDVMAELGHGRRGPLLRQWLPFVSDADAEALERGLKALRAAVNAARVRPVPVG